MIIRSTVGSLQPPLVARNGRTLKVLAICRISTVHQDEQSLADQEASYLGWIRSHTDLPPDVTVVASQGSGECLDRVEHLRTIELVGSGQFDLVITEDLGRICRRVQAHVFCEMCEDCETRLVALNDHVDTGREDWRLNSFFAVMRHETYNRDTSQRIRRSLRNRFSHGGVFQYPIYGYIKPEGARNDEEVHKELEADPVYNEWFRMLENGASFAEVADMLNENDISPGPYCRSAKWDGRMVGRITRNPILKGVRVRNKKMSRRINRTGRRRSVNAPPEDRLERHCPHLAFIETQRYDRLIRLLEDRNRDYRRRGENGRDPRANIPKKRTRFPGQSVHCGVCGRLYVFGGHGQKERLMCTGAREHKCWNGITFDSRLARKRLVDAIFNAIETLPLFKQEWRQRIEAAVDNSDNSVEEQIAQCSRRIAKNEKARQHIASAIEEVGGDDLLIDRLKSLNIKRDDLLRDRTCLSSLPTKKIAIPNAEQLANLARQTMNNLAEESPEFGRLMNDLIRDLRVFPYRLIDGGIPVLRARGKIVLATLVPGAEVLPDVSSALETEFIIDLFEPPQRVVHLEQVKEFVTQGELKEREMAAALEVTQPAVQRAKKLARRMEREGITDPYAPLSEPPDNCNKMRRHKHKRYEFDPLPGFGCVSDD